MPDCQEHTHAPRLSARCRLLIGEVDQSDAIDLARSLLRARTDCVPVPRPAGLDLALAAAVRRVTIDQLTEDGPVAAYKVSLSTRTWGALAGNAVVKSGAHIARNTLIDPLLEAEIAFRIERSIPPGAGIDALLDSCSVTPAIEVADSRWEEWRPSARDRFVAPDAAQIEADNAMSGLLVVGETWQPARDVPLETLTIAMLEEERERTRGPLCAVMGGPAHAVQWLIDTLAQEGRQVLPGQIISSGCPCPDLITVPIEGGRFASCVEGFARTLVTFN